MDSKKSNRHALLIVFDYNINAILSNGGITVEPLNSLLAMNTDLRIAYNISTELFNIPRSNITIITDVIPPFGNQRPWDPLRSSGDNPRVVQLPYPDITCVIREIAQFIENTIRNIKDTISKGGPDISKEEVFIYISCHGARIPVSCGENNIIDSYDNGLILMAKREGNHYERRYLRSGDIFSLFFGHNEVTPEGIMSVPITRRKLISSPSPYYLFEDDEMCNVRLTPISEVEPKSTRTSYKEMRGLPFSTKMLVVFDTCHSGSMADFHYIYDPYDCKMMITSNPPIGFIYPHCVSLSAAEDEHDAPSTSNGSPFTRHLHRIFSEGNSLTIQQFHERMYKDLPVSLRTCKPTICSTYCDLKQIIPFS
jgi:hypothetical protein